MPTTRRYSNTSYRTTNRRRWNTTRTNQWNTSYHYNPTTYSKNTPAFKQPRTECDWRIASYQAVYNQFSGAGNRTVFSPATANKWIRFINHGYRVYQFTSPQFSRYFGAKWNNENPTACFRWLRRKFGVGIKAVTRGKNNTWLVAATPNVTRRPFQNYNWNWK